MPFFKKSRSSVTAGPTESKEDPSGLGSEEPKSNSIDITNTVLLAPDGEVVSSDAQDGVKQAQATTIVWSRNALLAAYGLIFLIFFINSLQQQTHNNVLVSVLSHFGESPLIATINIVYTLVAGVIKLPVAKLMDVWGRPLGFCLMLFCAVLGLILLAACQNVETIAAALVFYWVGFDGISYVLDVFIADTSSLKWRALMFAFSTSPYIATTFAGPAAASNFVGPTPTKVDIFVTRNFWRWAYGVFAIVIPVISLPFLFIFWYNQREAKRQGILVTRREASGRTWYQSVLHYLVEFDVFGVVLLCAGWVLVLLPISLASSYAEKWKKASNIAMIVIGFCCLVAFGIYERFFARKSFLPFHFLIDRTVLGSCICAGTLFVSFYCWDAYFLYYLRVVHQLNVKNAGYVSNIYNIGSCFWAIIVGLLVRASGRYKWMAVTAVPFQILFTGLMIYFRQPHWDVGYVIMCQIFIAFSGGTLVVLEELAIMAAVGPENVAAALALQALFTSIGGSIGLAVSGAIWTSQFPVLLAKYLPASAQADLMTIYASTEVQLTYEWGSPVREAIVKAYGESQRYMCIAATAILALAMVAVCFWRDTRVKDFKPPTGSKVF